MTIVDLWSYLLPSGAICASLKWVSDLCAHNPTRHKLIQILEQEHPKRKYHLLLDALLRRFDSAWGPPWSLRALLVSIAFATCYIDFFFLLAYALGGPGNVGRLNLIDHRSGRRWAWPLAALATAWVVIALVRRRAALRAWLRVAMERRLGIAWWELAIILGFVQYMSAVIDTCRSGWRMNALLNISMCIALPISVWGLRDLAVLVWIGGVATSTIGNIVGLVIGNYNGVLYLTNLSGLSVATTALLATAPQGPTMKRPLLPGFIGLLAIVLLSLYGGLYVASEDVPPPTLGLVLVFVVAPILSGAADWVCWAISRQFIQRARRAETLSSIAGCVALDVTTAAVLLLALIFALRIAIAVVNWIYQKHGGDSVNWLAWAEAAHGAPWTSGITVTLILLTTLIPAALHVLVAALAVIVRLFQGRKLAAYLKRLSEDSSPSGGNLLEPVMAAVWIVACLVAAAAVPVTLGFALASLGKAPVGALLYRISRALTG